MRINFQFALPIIFIVAIIGFMLYMKYKSEMGM
jgi:hypothetical protein